MEDKSILINLKHRLIRWPTGRMRILILLTLLIVYSLNIIPTSGAIKEFRGQYNITAYLDGPFSGTTTISQESSDSSLTTFFGTFVIKNIIHYSNVKLSHSSKGYVSISAWNSYIDDAGNIVKSESTWALHISGYQEVTVQMTYEYGNYQILSNTETIYEESYSQRYYEDGVLQESVECRDRMEVETEEKKTTKAGTFDCIRIKTTYYENEINAGYSLIWITEEGTLIQNQVYDEHGSISMELSLISESEPKPFPIEVLFLIVIAIGGGVILIGFYIYRKRLAPSVPSSQSMIKVDTTYPKTCPYCGSPVMSLHIFCENCGKKLKR